MLKHYKMCLNPAKCAFNMSHGKFLGFTISQRGIEANLKKIKGFGNMHTPKTQNDVQSLMSLIAAITRFISKGIDCCASFFKALKGLNK